MNRGCPPYQSSVFKGLLHFIEKFNVQSTDFSVFLILNKFFQYIDFFIFWCIVLLEGSNNHREGRRLL